MDQNILTNKIILYLKQRLEKMASQVNQRSVIKDIYLETHISAGYFLVLTIANLIALSGLITNNVAVIIGAMLISPLMGPILSSGFAFVTGDNMIGKSALRKVGLSVVVTVLIAAIASYFSPMQDVTNEIISRTRPNLYDLIIAFLAGTVGAIAICTRKNYITIVPGVAIATAVIPPLSVAGFGLGTFNGYIAGGGFFLFFTNIVAIIFATSIVFFVYGFRPGIITELNIFQLKKRIAFLSVGFIVISIPLIYTLHVSISQVRMRSNIQSILREELDVPGRTNLVNFNYLEGKNLLDISAVVNTVEYLRDRELERVEKRIAGYYKQDTRLNVEQIQVRAGGLRDDAVISPILPAVSHQVAQAGEIIQKSRESSVGAVRKTVEKIERIIVPSTVDDFSLAYQYRTSSVSIVLKIRRDNPLSDGEKHWLSRMLTDELQMPVNLEVETTPFLTPLVFENGGKTLSNEMKDDLAVIKDLYQKTPELNINIISYQVSDSKQEKRHAENRAGAVYACLTEQYGIPSDRIKTTIHKKRGTKPMVRVSIHNE